MNLRSLPALLLVASALAASPLHAFAAADSSVIILHSPLKGLHPGKRSDTNCPGQRA